MDFYMKIEDGAAVGMPQPRPAAVVLLADPRPVPSKVGCAHWNDEEMSSLAGWCKVDPDSGYDPAIHVPTGGGSFDPQTVLATPAFTPRALADLKAEACVKIDGQAEVTRQSFITPGSGQALVYEKKAEEARQWQAAVDAAAASSGDAPVLADFPFLKARAERLGPATPDYQAVADEWNARSASWVSIAAEIEDVREGAKEGVDAAGDAAAVQGIVNTAMVGFEAIRALAGADARTFIYRGDRGGAENGAAVPRRQPGLPGGDAGGDAAGSPLHRSPHRDRPFQGGGEDQWASWPRGSFLGRYYCGHLRGRCSLRRLRPGRSRTATTGRCSAR